MAAVARNRLRFYTVNALGVVLGILFIQTGAHKLIGWEWAKQSYLRYHPLWVYYGSGIVEILGGAALLFPKSRFIGALSILLMSLAVAAHPWRADYREIIVPAVTLSLALFLVAWLSRPRQKPATPTARF